jgi:hypothetical protein
MLFVRLSHTKRKSQPANGEGVLTKKNYEFFLIVIHLGPPPDNFPQDSAIVSNTRSKRNEGFRYGFFGFVVILAECFSWLEDMVAEF